VSTGAAAPGSCSALSSGLTDSSVSYTQPPFYVKIFGVGGLTLSFPPFPPFSLISLPQSAAGDFYGGGSEIWRDFMSIVSIIVNLQCFDAVGWAAGRASVHPQKVFLITVKLVCR